MLEENKGYNSKGFKFTKEDIKAIIQLHQNGRHQSYISRQIGCSTASVSNLIKAYNGNLVKLNYLSKPTQDIIRELSVYYNNKPIKELNKKQEYPTYQCKILFGLIKLTFKPIELCQ